MSTSIAALSTSKPLTSAAGQPGALAPDELVDQFSRGNVLLMIGDDIPDEQDGTLLLDGWAAELAQRAGLNDSAPRFAQAAQAYEDKAGRQALIQYVRDRLDRQSGNAQCFQRAVARLRDSNVLATTSLDRRLQRAFEEVGRPLQVIVRDADVPFEDERSSQLFCLRGSVDQVDTLVLTEDDVEAFLDDRSSLSVVLQGYLARKTILFIGFDLTEPTFRFLYLKVTSALDGFSRRSYVVGRMGADADQRWCKRHGIDVIAAQPAEFLETLHSQLLALHQPQPAATPGAADAPTTAGENEALLRRPYKLLDYYDSTDAAIFFGREEESRRLVSLIYAHRLTVLYGASGTGKTSLLLAGVTPRLERANPPLAVTYARSLDDPGLAIRRALQIRYPQLSVAAGASLLDLVESAARLPADTTQPAAAQATVQAAVPPAQTAPQTIVILLDQFEEFFIRTASLQARQPFIAELAQLCEARLAPVKLVISLREDYLAALSELRDSIPRVLQVSMRVLPLTLEQAQQAIVGPAAQVGLRYAPEVITTLLTDLAAASPNPLADTDNSQIMPTQLQLVCDALYDSTLAKGRTLVTMDAYRAIGGAQGILKNYIDEALRGYSAGDRQLARNILMALVTSQRTKSTATVAVLATGLGVEQAAVERVLRQLVQQRLVRRLDDSQAYELAHDVLALTIADWISDEDWRLKRTQEMVQRGMVEWQRDRTLLPSAARFARVSELRDQLRLSPDETAFLFCTAVQYNQDVDYWQHRLGSPEQSAALLRSMLWMDNGAARANSARCLSAFSDPAVQTDLATVALQDAQPEVRDVAAASLAAQHGEVGVAALATAAANPATRAGATHALAVVADNEPADQPDLLAQVPHDLRRQARYELARLRLHAARSHLLRSAAAGAVGGALGFGLGLTLTFVRADMEKVTSSTLGYYLLVVLVMALLGALAGAGIGLGTQLLAALARRHARLGPVLGGIAGGAASYVAVLWIFASSAAHTAGAVLIAGLGCALFGALTALGILWPLVGGHRTLALLGGAIGGALGLVVVGLLGFDPAAPRGATSLAVTLAAGCLVGLCQALALSRAANGIAGRPTQAAVQQKVAAS